MERPLPFHNSLAFRLLIASIILLALPLLVDSFVLVQESYQDSINDAKEYLIEVAKNREDSIAQLQPIRPPFLIVLEYFFNLSRDFPQKNSVELQERLHKLAEAGNFQEVNLLKITEEGRYIVVSSSDVSKLGEDESTLVTISDVYSKENYEKGYFTYTTYDQKTLEPTIFLGRVVYDDETAKPVGLVLVTKNIAAPLGHILHSVGIDYPVNFALLLKDTLVFSASDPLLEFKYFSPLQEKHRALLLKLEPFIKFYLPETPIESNYQKDESFFDFTWEGGEQLGYLKKILGTDYTLLSYASKKEIYTKPLNRSLRVTSSYLLILLIGSFLALLLTLRMSAPLRLLSNVMHKMQAGDLSARYVPDSLGFEINQLGESYNVMIDTLLEKQNLVQAEHVARETVEKELRMGQEVQRGLLPHKMPSYPGVDIAELYIPAREVSGDFYGVNKIELNGKSYLTLYIGDASGKGISACFYSLGVRSMLNAYAQSYEDCAQILVSANQLFLRDTGDTGMFVTLLMTTYYAETRELHYFSCGHNPAIIRRQEGSIVMLKLGTIALGVLSLKEQQSEKVTLHPGDTLLLYTDGITEAHNVEGELFGEERLKNVMLASTGQTAESMKIAIHEAVKEFVGTRAPHDDITLLVLHIL